MSSLSFHFGFPESSSLDSPDDRQSAMDSYSTPAFFHSGDLYRSTTATTDVPAPPPEKDDPSMADLTPRPWATFKTEAGVITTMVFETYRNQRFNPLKQVSSTLDHRDCWSVGGMFP